jgi:hypothetical protein
MSHTAIARFADRSLARKHHPDEVRVAGGHRDLARVALEVNHGAKVPGRGEAVRVIARPTK